MPHKNPRISVVLHPEVAATVRTLAQKTDQSQSKLIADILHGTHHVLLRTLRVLEAAERAKADLRAKTVQDLERAQGIIHASIGLSDRLFDDIESTIQGAEEGAQPPSSNRGVNSHKSAPIPGVKGSNHGQV